MTISFEPAASTPRIWLPVTTIFSRAFASAPLAFAQGGSAQSAALELSAVATPGPNISQSPAVPRQKVLSLTHAATFFNAQRPALRASAPPPVGGALPARCAARPHIAARRRRWPETARLRAAAATRDRN